MLIAPYIFILVMMSLLFGLCVTVLRLKLGIMYESQGNPKLMKFSRIFGNFIEWVPFCLFVIYLCEVRGAESWLVHALCVSLVAGRVLHALGLFVKDAPNFGRVVGTVLTQASLGFGSIYLLLDFLK